MFTFAASMQKLLELYKQWSGAEPATTEKLPGAGSNRQYYRLTAADGTTVIGCIGTSRDENHAFICLAQHFTKRQLPVPCVLATSADELRYLQTDLGSVSLFDAIRGGREAGGRYTLAEQQLLKLMLIDSDYVKLPEDIKDDVFNDRVSSSLYQAIQAEDKGERPLNMERLTEQLDVDGAQLLGAVTAKIIPGDRENEIYGDCIRFIRLNKLKNEEAGIRSRLSNPDLSREEMEKLMQRQIEIQKKIKG